MTLQLRGRMLEILLTGAGLQLRGRIMGSMKCKTCAQSWSVSTKNAEAVIASNHTYLNPGHRVHTVWTDPQERANAS